MDRGRVGEERGSKEMDRCPLTVSPTHIKLSGMAYAIEAMYQIVNQWEYVVILVCDGDEGAVVLHKA
jgi:hypothetical protein